MSFILQNVMCLSVIELMIIQQNGITKSVTWTKSCSFEYYLARCHSGQYKSAECHSAECLLAECRGAAHYNVPPLKECTQ
jgi:hypothetical protein